MKAMWNGAVLAESDQTIVVEGNHYFPSDSIHQQHFKPSSTQTICGWKGTASYFTIEVNGNKNPDAAWAFLRYLQTPKAVDAISRSGLIVPVKGWDKLPAQKQEPGAAIVANATSLTLPFVCIKRPLDDVRSSGVPVPLARFATRLRPVSSTWPRPAPWQLSRTT